jgi:hypothetical protein
MKKILIAIVLLVAMLPVYAQKDKAKDKTKGNKGGNSERLDAAQVPELVKSSFNTAFPGIPATWEKHSAKGKADGKSYTKYVAVFTQDGQKSRARYREDGTALSSTKYMKADKMPDAVKSGMKTKYPGFEASGGEEVKGKGDKKIYRIKAKKGSAKLTTYFDENGNEVTKEKVTDDVKEGEDEDEGN